MEPPKSPPFDLPPVKAAEGSREDPPISPAENKTEATPAILPSQQPPPTQTASTSGPSVSAPQIADDVDLIEKEWVSKIQEIIQKTHGDPFERARQIAFLKSEYLQKRYQKAIKLI